MKLTAQLVLLCLLFIPLATFSQEIELYQQLNGRYDYLAFGNTLNLEENTGGTGICDILTESSASFEIAPNQTIIAAYLYWAGSGTGDFEVTFQGNPIEAERTFSETIDGQLFYFSAFADVTNIVQANGNAVYTLSDLDLTSVISSYCDNTTNFGGWSVAVVYEDEALNVNQVNIFDGLEGVSQFNNEITITLQNLNVLDNEGAKIGFLAWEGDSILAVTETLQINGSVLSNPPLNPANNAFNSTNSFTNSSTLYNMDMDFYNIENNIAPGDQQAEIKLTSGQDFIMINNVITVLNIELPDATIAFTVVEGSTSCGDFDVEIAYTVRNDNSTGPLPANTPIAFYANEVLVGQSQTQNDIPIDGLEENTIILSLPESTPATFNLRVVVDDNGSGNGIVSEINEDNNEAIEELQLLKFPDVSSVQNLELCDVFGVELFDLTNATSNISSENTIAYYLSETDAENQENAIATVDAFENSDNPQTIWIRVANDDCFVITSFTVEVITCPLPDATIAITNNLNACRGREFLIAYTVSNTEGTATLPANTAIAFYIDTNLVAQAFTQNDIPQGESESASISFFIPDTVPDVFELVLVVDDDGTGMGSIQELNEFNNSFQQTVSFVSIGALEALPPLIACDTGFDTAIFNLTTQNQLVQSSSDGVVTYFLNEIDAFENTNSIEDPEQFQNTEDPQIIWVRLENEICFETASFEIKTENCEPFIPQGFSPNGDGINDEFEITGLLNVFEDFELQIYSRKGNLIYQGGNSKGFWDGTPNRGRSFNKNALVPVGTYYYVLQLNDPNYPNPFIGFVYINY